MAASGWESAEGSHYLWEVAFLSCTMKASMHVCDKTLCRCLRMLSCVLRSYRKRKFHPAFPPIITRRKSNYSRKLLWYTYCVGSGIYLCTFKLYSLEQVTQASIILARKRNFKKLDKSNPQISSLRMKNIHIYSTSHLCHKLINLLYFLNLHNLEGDKRLFRKYKRLWYWYIYTHISIYTVKTDIHTKRLRKVS